MRVGEIRRCFVVLAGSLCLSASIATNAQDEDAQAEMDRAADALSDFLGSLQGLRDELPDRTLNGTVRATWVIDEREAWGYRQMYCSAFGVLTLKPNSLESYPHGQWGEAEGSVSVDGSYSSLHEREYYGDTRVDWRGAGTVVANIGISTFDDGTYRITYSSPDIPVRERLQRDDRPAEEYDSHKCSMSLSVEDVPLQAEDQPFAGTHTDRGMTLTWEFRPNLCAAGELAPVESPLARPEPTGKSEIVHEALVGALNARGLPVTPGHIDAYEHGGLLNFTIRVSTDTCILPAMREIFPRCIEPGSQEGALQLALGAIQQFGGRTRATIRMIDVETARIRSAGGGDAQGTDGAAIERALGRAIDDMGQRFACVRGVQ